MKKIVFVCTGNACRSAAAEFVLKKLLHEQQLTNIEVTSVGTMNCREMPRDEVMAKIASEHGYTMEGRTTYMTSEILDAADLILVMTSYHRDRITSLLKYTHWDRIHLFMDYCFGENIDLTDPCAQTETVYRNVFDKIEEGCKILVTKLEQSDRTA